MHNGLTFNLYIWPGRIFMWTMANINTTYLHFICRQSILKIPLWALTSACFSIVCFYLSLYFKLIYRWILFFKSNIFGFTLFFEHNKLLVFWKLSKCNDIDAMIIEIASQSIFQTEINWKHKQNKLCRLVIASQKRWNRTQNKTQKYSIFNVIYLFFVQHGSFSGLLLLHFIRSSALEIGNIQSSLY